MNCMIEKKQVCRQGKDDLSIILPAKCESNSIGALVERLREMYPNAEIIVVNDGSTDDTGSVAEKAGAQVVSHPYAKGNGSAIKTGVRIASGKLLVFMDADGQHDPQDVPRLLARLNTGYDMVVGARQRGSQASVGRGFANAFYNRLASYMTGHLIEDLTSGFRVTRADKFRKFLYLLPNGFSYPTTSTMAFFRAGYSVAYEPIHAASRIGRSHINPLKDGLRFLLIIFKIGTLYSPLKLFVPIGGFFFAAGFFLYLYNYIVYQHFTNMSALLISVSFLIFLIGLVSEQITALLFKGTE